MARWFLGPPAWKDLEAILSDRPAELVAPPITVEHTGARSEDPYRPAQRVPYAELHAHSHFSFLDGASSPADMVEQAARLGLDAIALVDHDGLPGAVRFASAAADAGIATVFGAELTLGLEPGAGAAGTTPVISSPRTGVPDPDGEHLLVLVRDETGYRRLSAAIARAHLDSGQKAAPRYRLAELSRLAREGHWLILTGCRKGAVTLPVIRDRDGDLQGSTREPGLPALGRLLQPVGRLDVLSRHHERLLRGRPAVLARTVRLVGAADLVRNLDRRHDRDAAPRDPAPGA